MQLSQAVDRGRDNNFNLMRLLAALAVLVAHSWPLTIGRSSTDPLGDLTGLDLARIAVDVFFFTSGLLVTASLWNRRHLGNFLLARALRIFPALFVVVVACILLGALLSSLPWREYFAHGDTWRFLRKNALMLWGMQDHLPGVFLHNPFPGAIDGSLWTLQTELRMYLLLALLWVLAALAGGRRPQAFGAFVLVAAAIALPLHAVEVLAPGKLPRALVFSMWSHGPEFLAGAACFVLRRHIRLDLRWFLFALGCIAVASALGPDVRLVRAVYVFALPYVVLFLAYVPGGAPRRFNAVGDYSYGIYIIAFPVQQTLAALVPGITVPWMIAAAACITTALAWCSWHFIEAPALGLKTMNGPRIWSPAAPYSAA